MQEPTQEQIEEFQAAQQQRIESAVAVLDETIDTVTEQLDASEGVGDEKSAKRLRKSLDTLNKRKQEIESGERPT